MINKTPKRTDDTTFNKPPQNYLSEQIANCFDENNNYVVGPIPPGDTIEAQND